MDNQIAVSVRQTFENVLLTLEKKNADYAQAANPFSNLDACEAVYGIRSEQGMLVRLLDKLSRAWNLLEKPPQVTDESLTDTIEDAIGYLALMKARIEARSATTKG